MEAVLLVKHVPHCKISRLRRRAAGNVPREIQPFQLLYLCGEKFKTLTIRTQTIIANHVNSLGLAGSSGLFLESLPTILVGRAVLGLAVAGVMVSATILIADYYSGSARAAFMGLQSGFMGLGGVLFLTLGGALAQQNWHYPFAIYLFAWLIVPLIVLFILEPNRAVSSHPHTSAGTEVANQSMPVGVMVIVYGLTTLSQIAFYLVPVQLPFFLEQLVQALPSQSGMAMLLK